MSLLYSSSFCSFCTYFTSTQVVQGKYQKLVDEKTLWKSLFQNIVSTSAVSTTGDKEVTPVNILRLLSTSQEKCSVLLKTQGDELKLIACFCILVV